MAGKMDWSNILGLPKIKVEDKSRTDFGRLARAQELSAEGLLNSKIVAKMREEGYSISKNALEKWETQGLLEKKSDKAIALIKELCQKGADLDEVYAAVQEQVSDNYHKQLIGVWYKKYCSDVEPVAELSSEGITDTEIFSLLQALAGVSMGSPDFESAIEEPLLEESSIASTPLALVANFLPEGAVTNAILGAKKFNETIQDLARALTGVRPNEGFDPYLKRLTKPLIKNTSFTPLYLIQALFPDYAQKDIHNIARGGQAEETQTKAPESKKPEIVSSEPSADDVVAITDYISTPEFLKTIADIANIDYEEQTYNAFIKVIGETLVKYGLFSFSEFIRSRSRWLTRQEIEIAKQAWEAVANRPGYRSYRSHLLMWPETENVSTNLGGYLMAQLEIHSAMEGKGFLTLEQIMAELHPHSTGITKEIVASELLNLVGSKRARIRGDYNQKLLKSDHIRAIIDQAATGSDYGQELLHKFGNWDEMQFQLNKTGYGEIVEALKSYPAFGIPSGNIRELPRNRNLPCVCGSGKKFKKCCQSLYNEVL